MATNNPLTELIPAQYRKYVYVVAAALVFLFGIWQAVGGDYKAFVLAVISGLVPALAASNTSEPEPPAEDNFYDGHQDEV